MCCSVFTWYVYVTHVHVLQHCMQCVAACCSVLQRVAVCCSVLQRGVDVLQCVAAFSRDMYTSHMSCQTYEWVMSHTWMSHVPHMNKVISHIWMSHVTHTNESCPTYERVPASCIVFVCVTWLVHVCDMFPSCVWHDSFIRSSIIYVLCNLVPVSRMVYVCVTWRIHVCDMTPSDMGHDSFMYVCCVG